MACRSQPDAAGAGSATHRAELCHALGPAADPADASQLEELLRQLLANAAEAIGDAPGSITAQLAARQVDATIFQQAYLAPELAAGSYAALSVQDTGVGVDEATQARIFEPFFSTWFPSCVY